MRGRVGELVGPSHIAGGIDVGVERLQVFVGLDGAVRGHANVFQAIALQACHTAHGADQRVKHDLDLLTLCGDHQNFVLPPALAAQRLVPGKHPHAIGLQCIACQHRHLQVLAHHDAIAHLDLSDLGTQAGKAL